MWEYVQTEQIAGAYDDYFALNRLFQFDEQVLARLFTTPGLVVDLGCGTGRTLIPLARRGFRGVGVDLSRHMLRIVGATRSVIISARLSGKIKAWVQGIAIISILCFLVWPDLLGVGEENVVDLARTLMWITAGYTLFSLFDYFWGNRKVLGELER